MADKLHSDGLGQKGLPLRNFAYRIGMSISTVKQLCEKGAIPSARKHPTTKQWWFYPPFKFSL